MKLKVLAMITAFLAMSACSAFDSTVLKKSETPFVKKSDSPWIAATVIKYSEDSKNP
jgi:hypothetical protein